MLRRLCYWIKGLFQRLLRRNPHVDSSVTTTEEQSPQLTDGEYESLLMELLQGVNDGWSSGWTREFLTTNNISNFDFVEWLQGFGDRLLGGDGVHEELGRRMVLLGDLGIGELSRVAGDVGVRLLRRGEELNRRGSSEKCGLGSFPQEQVFKREDEEEEEGGDVSGVEDEDAEECWEEANRKFDVGDFKGAVASYDKALAIKPDYQDAWYNRGVALGNLVRYEQAIASFDKAIEFKPDKHQAWIGRGIAAGNSFSCDPFLSFMSNVTRQNPHLKKRGYEGELASFEEGLKHCPRDTHPESWGKLHQAIGNAHYYQGRSASHPRSYRHKAVAEYSQALTTLTAADFPEAHLEVLQDLIRVRLDLGDIAKAEELQRRGTDVLRRLLDECPSDGKKQQLGLKFAGFQQLTVDMTVQSGNWCAALELAEKGKNACLSWLLDNGDEVSLTWKEIQQLLNPTTAIVYWHLSPAALHTFILKHDTLSPMVLGKTLHVVIQHDISSPIVLRETKFVNPAQRLHELEEWVKEWNQQYANRKDKKEGGEKKKGDWRKNLPDMLHRLANVLDISAIIQAIQTSTSSVTNPKSKIQNLILVPHRDLHRLPLHALFPDNFTITYLPSAQIGLSLAELSSKQQNIDSPTKLLSVEHPNSTDFANKSFDKLPYAEMESATISRMFANPLRLAEKAITKETLKVALTSSGHNLFHFTGHGTYNFHNPKESALALSGKHRLTLEDILQLSLRNYKMVSLSACETGVTGKQTITTEYVGLVSGFLRQGVSHVVSTLWTAESVSSALFMIEFYRQPDWDVAPATALKRTQMWLRSVTYRELIEWYSDRAEELAEYNDIDAEELSDEADNIRNNPGKMDSQIPPYAHPYYWANFTITGNINS